MCFQTPKVKASIISMILADGRDDVPVVTQLVTWTHPWGASNHPPTYDLSPGVDGTTPPGA